MTSECPAHISNCGQLFRPFWAHQHSVANAGAAQPEIYMKTSFRDMTDLSFLLYPCVPHPHPSFVFTQTLSAPQCMCFTYMTYLLKCLIITIPASRQRQILVEQLDAKTAKVEKLVVKDFAVNAGGKFHVETSNADLAYYMKLKEADQYDDLEEGDIVGFYEDEESGETYIQRLRSNNIHNALHAGVISRSHWLAGHKPLAAGTYTYLKFLFLIRVYDSRSICSMGSL